jgi:hypothetical protein
MKKPNRLLQLGVTVLATGSLLQAPNCLPNFTQQVVAQISGRSAAIIGNAFELALVELFG